MAHPTQQVVIVHLSDIHFGSGHRFDPLEAEGGGPGVAAGRTTLLESLLKDLDLPDPECPVLICLTGDLTTINSDQEYRRAEELVHGLATNPVLGRVRGIESIFAIPGNHDVDYTPGLDMRARLRNWMDFENRVWGTNVRPEKPFDGVLVHDLVDSKGVIVVRVNSAAYVERATKEEKRGVVDEAQLEALDQQLRHIPKTRRESAIRIALVHHHPILIPQLAEPGRGYDAIQNSGQLLTLLRRHGVHVVLHGHKHDPHIFAEDSRPGFAQAYRQPMIVAAGGSAGSRELPPPNRRNSYNLVWVKWHPDAQQTRVSIETRALITHSPENDLLPSKRWHWESLLRDDRHFVGGRNSPKNGGTPSRWNAAQFEGEEIVRKGEYGRLRLNFPVVEVRPSLIPDQAYEAVLWIEPHPGRTPSQIPKEVTWCAGPKFGTVVVQREEDERFCVRFDYWGGFLAQARIAFEDGEVEFAHIYARLPTGYENG